MKYILFTLASFIISVHTAFSQIIVSKSEDRFDLSYDGKALIQGVERYSEVGKSFNLLVMGGVLIPSQKSELEKKFEACTANTLEESISECSCTCLMEVSNFNYINQDSSSVLEGEHYYYLKGGKLGYFNAATGYLLEPEFEKLSLDISPTGRFISNYKELSGNLSTAVLNIDNGEVTLSGFDNITLLKTPKDERIAMTITEGLSTFSSLNGNNLFQTRNDIKLVFLAINKCRVFFGFLEKDNKGYALYNNRFEKVYDNLTSAVPIYDCSLNEFVFQISIDKKHGLISTDGKVIVSPVNQNHVKPLGKRRYLIKNGDQETIVKSKRIR